MSEPMAFDAPPSIRAFGLRWEVTRHPLRFGVSDGCRGVGGYRTPLGAYFGLRRWRKEPAIPTEGSDESEEQG